MRNRNPKSMVYMDDFPRGVGRQNILLILTPICVLFVEQPVVSLSLSNGAIQWLVGVGWEWPVISNRSPLKMYVRNR